MQVSGFQKVAMVLAALGMTVSLPAEAKQHRKSGDPGHGHCLRFNKTTGAIAGGVGGALIGKAVFGGPVAIVAGAAGGAIAGHKLARNGRKHCS